MEVAGLASVDWSAPWLAPFAGLGRTVSAELNWRRSFDEKAAAAGVFNFKGLRLEFCEPDVADGEPYEAGIARTGRVPTRANLHDFFNALIFLHFPTTKAQLNRLQSEAITRDGVGAVRGPVRDAATLLDENGVLVITDRSDVVESLRSHNWERLFLDARAAWPAEVNVIAFGHALLHKLVQPYKTITAHALHVSISASSPIQEIDRSTAATLDEQLSSTDLMPLPVLGVPGWWKENEDPDFYSDRLVFRPAKMRRDRKAETDS